MRRLDLGVAVGLWLASGLGAVASDDSGPRVRQSWNEGWRFKRQAAPGAAVEAEFLLAEQAGYRDAGWSSVTLPHTWDATPDNPFTVPQHFRGIGWYRKSFVPPAAWRGRHVWIEFKGAFQVADVWLNGRHLGGHVGGFTGFQFDLTEALKWEGTNLLAVRVNDVLDPEIAPANETNVPGYGGIYRSVSVFTTGAVRIANSPAIATEQSGPSATVRVHASLRNLEAAAAAAAFQCALRDREGRTVATRDATVKLGAKEGGSLDLTFEVPAPQLWSPDSPYLYTMVSTVSIARRAVDRVESPFGIRTMSYDAAQGFLLNGVPINLHGVNRRQDYGFLGDAVPEAIAVKDIRLIKEMGANFIRTAHYPQDPAILDACDRMGILVWEEIPNIKIYVYPPAGDRDQPEPVYTERFPRALIANLKQQLMEMIERDRNHPSIIIWGLADDLSTYHFPEDFVELSNAAHAIDPTRWTAGRAPHVTDVIDATSERDLAGEHQRHPERKYIWNEWGAYASERGREGSPYSPRQSADPVSAALADSDAALLLEADWMRWAGMPWLGTAKWCMFDAGEVNKTQTTTLWTIPREGTVSLRWPYNDYLGVADMWRLPKEGFYFLQSQWAAEPMVHITGHWTWPVSAGGKRIVRVYSNCDTVELLLNGRSLGVHESAPAERVLSDVAALRRRPSTRTVEGKLAHGPFIWDDVAYEAGALAAVGRKGAITVRSELRTAQAPARIELRADASELVAGAGDVAFMRADVVDAAGTTVPGARPWIHFAVLSGPGRLLGPADIDAITGVAAFNVESTSEAGEIVVKATAEGLSGGTVRLLSKPARR